MNEQDKLFIAFFIALLGGVASLLITTSLIGPKTLGIVGGALVVYVALRLLEIFKR